MKQEQTNQNKHEMQYEDADKDEHTENKTSKTKKQTKGNEMETDKT